MAPYSATFDNVRFIDLNGNPCNPGEGTCTQRTESEKDRRTGCDRRKADYTVLLGFDRRSGSDRRGRPNR